MQTNANRSKRYLVLERTHMAIDKEIQKHRINIEIIKKDYVAICDRRRNWELQSGKLRSTTAITRQPPPTIHCMFGRTRKCFCASLASSLAMASPPQRCAMRAKKTLRPQPLREEEG